MTPVNIASAGAIDVARGAGLHPGAPDRTFDYQVGVRGTWVSPAQRAPRARSTRLSGKERAVMHEEHVLPRRLADHALGVQRDALAEPVGERFHLDELPAQVVAGQRSGVADHPSGRIWSAPDSRTLTRTKVVLVLAAPVKEHP